MFKLLSIILCLWYYPNYKTVDKLVERCNTPERLAYWVNGHIINDGSGGDLTAQELLAQNSGNCVDIANLYYICLQRLGYKPKLMSIYDKDGGHRVCIVYNEYDDMWYYCDEIGIHKTYAFNEKQIADYVNLRWESCRIYKQ